MDPIPTTSQHLKAVLEEHLPSPCSVSLLSPTDHGRGPVPLVHLHLERIEPAGSRVWSWLGFGSRLRLTYVFSIAPSDDIQRDQTLLSRGRRALLDARGTSDLEITTREVERGPRTWAATWQALQVPARPAVLIQADVRT